MGSFLGQRACARLLAVCRTTGVKAPIIYDADAEHPIYAAITPARVIDTKAAQQMPIEPGAPMSLIFLL